MSGTLVASGLSKIGRPDLAQIPVPEATSTHKPVPHHTIVEALVETLSFRQIGVVQEEYAVSSDGMKMFGVLDLETQMEGCRFSIGTRNSHDKSIRLGLTAGLRVFVCSNMAFSGDFTPVLAKHTKSFNLVDTLSVGVDRIQRNFEPLQRQVETWRQTQITDDTAKLILYSAFVDGKLEAPRSATRGPPAVLRTAVPGIRGQDDVEPFERVYQRLQEARSAAAVQSDSQARRLSRTAAELTRDLRFSLHDSGDHAVLFSSESLRIEPAVPVSRGRNGHVLRLVNTVTLHRRGSRTQS